MAVHHPVGAALFAAALLLAACSSEIDLSDGVNTPEECAAVGREVNSRVVTDAQVGHFSPVMGTPNTAFWDPVGERCLINGLPSTHGEHPIMSAPECEAHGGYYHRLPASGTAPEFCLID